MNPTEINKFGNLIRELEHFYSNWLTADFSKLSDFYSPNATFIDPITRVEGIPAMRKYFEGTQNGLLGCTFHFSPAVVTQDKACLVWTMAFNHRKLARGRPLQIEGVSRLEYDAQLERITMQQDYYDMGAMIYAHVPVLGQAVKMINQRISQSH